MPIIEEVSTPVEPLRQYDGDSEEKRAEDSGDDVPALQGRADDLRAQAEELKAKGNSQYAEGQFVAAKQLYESALEIAPLGSKGRPIYNANIAACCLKLNDNKGAVQFCSAALEEDPGYVKAYMRRSSAYQNLDDLENALNDARKVLELESDSSWAHGIIKQLEPQVRERQERLKEEMLGKLKELGNTVLGKFGLSLDNFKTEQDPASGGYSIKFQS